MDSIRSLVPWHVFLIVLALLAPAAHGSDVDLLIDKLVSKGILSQAEADEIAAEMTHEARAAAATVPVQDLAAAQPAAASSPAKVDHWYDRFALKGDMRVRYQAEDLDNVPIISSLDIDEQQRMRIRWRLGAVADLDERWQVGFGLASGGSDPRSTNQTLRDAFSTGDARLDYGYARYQASEQVAALAGKFKNPLWTPKDLLWDSDIRPDGFALPMEFSVSERVETFFTPAYLVITENVVNNRDGAAVLLLQGGAKFAISDRVSLKLAPAYYDFSKLKGTPGPLSVDVPSNSRDAEGLLVNDYNALAFGGQLDISGSDLVPRVSLFGEWVTNFDADEDDSGWLAGISLGSSKVAGFGDWELKYNYRRLEADAWPEFLTDSDHFFGATNVKGNELEFIWGVAKGVNLSLDYYGDVKFLGTDITQDLVQIDLNLKW